MRLAVAAGIGALLLATTAFFGADREVRAQADSPPSASITAPAPGTVSGTVTIEVTATDDVGVEKVRFWAGRTYLGYDTSAPFRMTWNTDDGANGPHAIKAQALDIWNQTGTAEVSVTVSNPDSTPPTVSISSPKNNHGVVGTVPIRVNASDSKGVEKVQFWAGGAYLGYDAIASYTKAWDSTTSPDGPQTIRVRAIDRANNATEKTITVIVANDDVTPPSVSIDAPLNGAKVLDTVTITATASDELALQKVQFWVDNVYLGYDTVAPYGKSWDPATVGNIAGPHNIRVRAVDWAGNYRDALISVQTWLTALDSPNPRAEGMYGLGLGHGDINNDDVQDIIVGATGEERVYVYSGVDLSLLRTLNSPNPGVWPDITNFGSAVAAGDTNGDGYDDVIVGASLEDREPFPPNGKAYVFSGADGSLLHTLSVTPTGYFGVSVASGDVNGDSYADVIVGAQHTSRVHVFSGLTGSLLYTINGPSSSTFGIRVAAGDVNNDGNADVVVMAWQGPGRAFVYSGPTGQQIYEITSPTQQTDGQITWMEPAVGDINNDGFADILIGRAQEDIGDNFDAGRVYVYSGATGLVIRTLDLPEPNVYDWFGVSIAIGDDAIFVGSWTEHPAGLRDGPVWKFDFAGNALGVVRSPSLPWVSTNFAVDLTVAGPHLVIGVNHYTGSGPSMQGRVYETEIAHVPSWP